VFLLILDSVQDPHNLGACLRTADAAGVHMVIAPKDHSVGLTPAVRKVACGAAEVLPFVQVTNLASTMKMLKARNIWLYGTSDKATQSIYQTDLKNGSIGLVMGAEGPGLRRLTQESCDVLVSIPMHGSVPSLNVAVATGVCLFEYVRQRQKKC
jgi:23S rRNA (guanosine2251-2'-O)-methyltransferase